MILSTTKAHRTQHLKRGFISLTFSCLLSLLGRSTYGSVVACLVIVTPSVLGFHFLIKLGEWKKWGKSKTQGVRDAGHGKRRCIGSISAPCISFFSYQKTFITILCCLQNLLKTQQPGCLTKMSLIGPSAIVWDVELKKNDNIEFGGDGWMKFVEAYNLQENSLLIFTYKQNLSFEVLIFDPESFCEKEANYVVKQCKHGKAEHENVKKRTVTEDFSMEMLEDEDSDNSDHSDSEFVVSKKPRNDVENPGRRKNSRTLRKTLLARPPQDRGRGKRMHRPRESQNKWKPQSEKEPEENGAIRGVVDKVPERNGAAEEQIHVSEREQNTVENGGSAPETAYSHKSTKREKGHKGNGLVYDVLEQKPEGNGAGQEQSHVSERQQSTVENGGNVLEVAYSQKSTEMTGRRKKQAPTTSPTKLILQSEKKYSNAYKSNRRPVTEIEKEDAFKRALAALQGSGERSFIVIMRPSSVYTRFYLNIPAGWMKQHLLHRNRRVMLHVGEKTWLTTFHCNSRNEGGLSGYGWKKFALENFLEESDICLFKLATQEGDSEVIMDVEIFRVIPEIVPPSPVGRSTSSLA